MEAIILRFIIIKLFFNSLFLFITGWFLFKIFLVHWFDHEVQSSSHTDQACHGVHGVVVQEGAGVHCARWHDGHQLGDGQCLGLYQGLSRDDVCSNATATAVSNSTAKL